MNTNTEILVWDVRIQKGLAILNALLILASLFGPLIYLLLFLQLLECPYQLISSGLHLGFPHKSIGYRQYRLIHFWGGLAYLALFAFVFIQLLNQPHDRLLLLTGVIIPQCIFYGYFALCYRELKQLQSREFHILR